MFMCTQRMDSQPQVLAVGISGCIAVDSVESSDCAEHWDTPPRVFAQSTGIKVDNLGIPCGFSRAVWGYCEDF